RFGEPDVGEDEIDARRFGRIPERDAAIDHDPFAMLRRAVAVEPEIHPDLADAAEWQEDKFVRVLEAHGRLAAAPKCTSPAATAVRTPACDITIRRPSSSSVSTLPRNMPSPSRTAPGAPIPAAWASQRRRISPIPAAPSQSA